MIDGATDQQVVVLTPALKRDIWHIIDGLLDQNCGSDLVDLGDILVLVAAKLGTRCKETRQQALAFAGAQAAVDMAGGRRCAEAEQFMAGASKAATSLGSLVAPWLSHVQVVISEVELMRFVARVRRTDSPSFALRRGANYFNWDAPAY